MYGVPHIDEVPHIVEGKDLEALIVSSIQTLKRNNKNVERRNSLFSTRIYGE